MSGGLQSLTADSPYRCRQDEVRVSLGLCCRENSCPPLGLST